MGQVLAKIFKIVEEKGGMNARIRLAAATGLSKKDIEKVKDKPELIEKFKAEADKILDCDIDDFLR